MSEENFKIWSWKSPKAIVSLIGLVLLAAIIVVSILRDRIVNQPINQVTITGQGKVSYNPDLAIVTLGVQIDKVAKPEDALNQLNAKVTGIIKAVKAAGISDDNIQTQNYNLSPQYEYANNATTPSGYGANEQLVIKVTGYDKDQNKLSQVIAVATKAGANQVSNLSFDASNLNDLKQQARVKAIADARAKSRDLAKAADVRLGEVSGWYENLIQPVSGMDYSAKGMGGAATVAAPQVPSGSREVIIEIGVNYNIK